MSLRTVGNAFMHSAAERINPFPTGVAMNQCVIATGNHLFRIRCAAHHPKGMGQRITSIRGIPTPVCGLARNDMLFLTRSVLFP